ncbi:hypothetical protein [Rhodosalinus halophilus]|nr:hypothetical protein [Rhodosalinus halophilus]
MNDGGDRVQPGSPRVAVAGAMALAGALLFVVFLYEDMEDALRAAEAALPWGPILGYVVAMGFGGAVAGALLSGAFGRRGIGGWFLSALAGVVTTTVGGMLGSLAGLLPSLISEGWTTGDLIGIGAGALILPLAIIDWPLLILIWIGLVVAAHLLARHRRPAA